MITENPGPDEFPFETVSVDIVYVTNARNDEGYSVTCLDAETGELIGSRLLPPASDGPPLITFGDFAELVGDTYRCTSVLVVIENGGWLRRNGSARHAVPFESPLEAYFLAKAPF